MIAEVTRDVVLIVGMHRSGSSAVTRMLSLCGGALPIQTLPPNRWNPTGYWEPVRAMEIDEMFLRACGSTWHDPRPHVQTNPPDAATRADFQTLIKELLRDGFEPTGPLLMKEPRATVLLPYWISAATELGHPVKLIHVFRHPADVASSLAERDGMDLDHCLAIWLAYNLTGERDGRTVRRTFVSYDEICDDWRGALRSCREDLDLDLPVDDVAERNVAAFVSRPLRHHRDSSALAWARDQCLVGWASEVYAALLAARRDGVANVARLDEIYAAYVDAEHARSSVRPRFIPATEA